MGNTLTGRTKIVGVKKGATWGTALAVGAGCGLLADSFGIFAGHTVEQLVDESLPQPFVRNVNPGLEKVEGSIAGRLRYQGTHELLLSMLFGSPQASSGTDPYTREILFSAENSGLFVTLAALMTSAEVYEIPSAKIMKGSISGEVGKEVQFDFGLTGDILRKTGETGIVNTVADLQNVDEDSNVAPNVAVFDGNGDFQINTQAGAALSTTDTVGITKFDLSVDRSGDDVNVTTGARRTRVEPLGSKAPDIRLKISLPDYRDAGYTITGSALKLALRDSTATYKSMVKIYKDANFSLYLYFPRLKAMTAAPGIDGPGRNPYDVEFMALEADSTPTGLTQTCPVYAVITNHQAAAWF